MKFLKNIFSVLAVVIFLAPTAINFAHLFSKHTHEVCEHYAEEHFHTKNLECELDQFQKNPALVFIFPEFVPAIQLSEKEELPDYYQFLSDHIKLPFELRGPPLA
ncbi:hypothetical protein [Salegentibacter sp.]|uniref:hypothetical protein n=1 Tax=Salegentibacter sp. TaxID=1903072 RepID=UPI003567CEE8